MMGESEHINESKRKRRLQILERNASSFRPVKVPGDLQFPVYLLFDFRFSDKLCINRDMIPIDSGNYRHCDLLAL